MKRTLILLFVLPLLLPFFSLAQFMKDYQPAGSPLVTSTVNLVSVVEGTPSPLRLSRSINTIQESATASTNDVWVHSVDSLGNVIFSRRYGLPNVDEVSSALIRCTNGDFIYAATTTLGGIRSAWLFRRGIINWSNRYTGGDINVRSLCIKKTNEAVENYIVAGTYNNDKSLLVFKISGAGGIMAWNRRYTDAAPPANLTDIPKSMLLKGDSVIIVGNRFSQNAGGAPVRDLFLIGVNQLNGNITHPYRIIDNGGRDDFDPFISFGVINGEFVLTYQTIANIAGINTGRASFTRLTNIFNLAAAASFLYWETNNTNTFGHTIYKGTTVSGNSYDIGGGTTIPGNIHNPIFFVISPTGAPIAGNYRRLWTTLDFNSTYMLQDAFTGIQRYEHHNWKRSSQQNSMSLLRDPALPSPCNDTPLLNATTVPVTLTFRGYNVASVITQTPYNIPDTIVHGNIIFCNGGGGVFKTGDSKPVFGEEQTVTGAFKTYPTPLRSGEQLRIQMTAGSAEPAGIKIYNAQAQVMYNGQEAAVKGFNQFNINTSGLKPGVYIVEVKQGTSAWRNKIVVE